MQNLARRLLQTERVQGAILWLLQMAIDQVRSDKEQKTAKMVAGILRDLLGESLPRLLKVLARREDFLSAQINQIFDQILLEFQLNEEQATRLADWVLQVVIPPDVLRLAAIDFLTDRTIQTIDERFREKTSGTYWVVANLFGLRNTLSRLRTYCLDEKDDTNARLQELFQDLQVRDRIRDFARNFFTKFAYRHGTAITKDDTRKCPSILTNTGSDLLQGLSESVDWGNIAVMLLNRLGNSPGCECFFRSRE